MKSSTTANGFKPIKIKNKKKKKKWVRIVINCFAILFLLCAIAGVGGVAWFLNYIVENSIRKKHHMKALKMCCKISGIAIVVMAIISDLL